MLSIETLKLMHRKTLKRLAAKNMRYRASWSDKIWDRKYDKKQDIKHHLFLIENIIHLYSDYQIICERSNWGFMQLYKYLSSRSIYDMTVKPHAFRIDESRISRV